MERAGATQGYSSVVSIERDTKVDEEEGREYEKMSETYMVVVTLIITASFAAGFTIPGGYESNDGPRKGTEILAKKAAFMAFVTTDVLAMMFSIIAMGILLMSAKKSDRS